MSTDTSSCPRSSDARKSSGDEAPVALSTTCESEANGDDSPRGVGAASVEGTAVSAESLESGSGSLVCGDDTDVATGTCFKDGDSIESVQSPPAAPRSQSIVGESLIPGDDGHPSACGKTLSQIREDLSALKDLPLQMRQVLDMLAQIADGITMKQQLVFDADAGNCQSDDHVERVRAQLAKEAAKRLSCILPPQPQEPPPIVPAPTVAEAGFCPLIGDSPRRLSLAGGAPGFDADLSSHHSKPQAGGCGAGRNYTRLPSAVPSRVQTRLGSRRQSMLESQGALIDNQGGHSRRVSNASHSMVSFQEACGHASHRQPSAASAGFNFSYGGPKDASDAAAAASLQTRCRRPSVGNFAPPGPFQEIKGPARLRRPSAPALMVDSSCQRSPGDFRRGGRSGSGHRREASPTVTVTGPGLRDVVPGAPAVEADHLDWRRRPSVAESLGPSLLQESVQETSENGNSDETDTKEGSEEESRSAISEPMLRDESKDEQNSEEIMQPFKLQTRESTEARRSFADHRPGRETMHSVVSFSSLSEASKPRCVMLPTSPLRLLMDIATIINIFCTGIIVPLKIVYMQQETSAYPILVAILIWLDVWWILFIVANFRTCYFDDGVWIADCRAIARKYVRGYLALDLLAAWPVLLMPASGIEFKWWFVSKMLRIVRLASIIHKVQQAYRYGNLWVAKLIMSAMLVMHTLTCVWRQANINDGVGLEQSSDLLILRYIEDLYWFVMTISTVGYGDIVPQGVYGRLFSIAIMMWAPAFMGSIASLLAHFSQHFFNDEVEHQVAQAIKFMQRRNVSMHLQRRIEYNFRHRMGKNAQPLTMAPDLFRHLSPAVQRDLSLELLRGIVLQFPLFKEAPRPFVAEIAQAHHWVQALPWDLIVERGQLVKELVFVVQGRVIIQVYGSDGFDTLGNQALDVAQLCVVDEEESDHLMAEEELIPGAWFGEKCLFDEARIRTCVGVAAMESELAVLRAEDYHRILSTYPNLRRQHEVIAQRLRMKELTFDRLEYKRPVLRPALRKGRSWGNIGWISTDSERLFTRLLRRMGLSSSPSPSPRVTMSSQLSLFASRRSMRASASHG